MRKMAAIVVLSALGVLGTAGTADAAAQPNPWSSLRCFRSVHVGVALGSVVTETQRTCWTRHGIRSRTNTVISPLGY